MALDPILRVAMSLYADPGAYALLLGSGVSRAAGIPTGWEVVEDLIRKVAATEGTPDPDDLVAWYVNQTGSQPSYSDIIERLAPSPEERRRLLHAYFERASAEADPAVKSPTAAHHAIAELVKSGLVRVIITTNFDRLLELALASAGVQPVVIASPDAIVGAPVVHRTRCTLVKIHGDYLDARIRNTANELSAYDDGTASFVSRILEDFGLIVAGWSADWDTALCALLERRVSRRHSVFWTHRSPLGPVAQGLTQLLSSQVVQVNSADDFFTRLRQKSTALSDAERPHPISTAVALAELKRYLPNAHDRIRLADFLDDEVESAKQHLAQHNTMDTQASLKLEDVEKRLDLYHAAVERLAILLANVGFWSTGEHVDACLRSISKIARLPQPTGGNAFLCALRDYPALYLIYAYGLGGILGHRIATTLPGILKVAVRENGVDEPFVKVRSAVSVLDVDTLRRTKRLLNRHTPGNDLIHEQLSVSIGSLASDQTEFDRSFDEFEYWYALLHASVAGRDPAPSNDWYWIPIGRYIWHDHEVVARIEKQIAEAGTQHWLLTTGVFANQSEMGLHVASVKREALKRFRHH